MSRRKKLDSFEWVTLRHKEVVDVGCGNDDRGMYAGVRPSAPRGVARVVAGWADAVRVAAWTRHRRDGARVPMRPYRGDRDFRPGNVHWRRVGRRHCAGAGGLECRQSGSVVLLGGLLHLSWRRAALDY